MALSHSPIGSTAETPFFRRYRTLPVRLKGAGMTMRDDRERGLVEAKIETEIKAQLNKNLAPEY